MNVLSLFNGMNCGFMALENLGVKVNKYFASEIDKYANQATKIINPETVFLGDVTKVSYKNGVLYWDGGQQQTKIDLILAGSPCQGFSFAGKQLNFDDDRSRLFFEFIRIKKEIEAENPKLKFLLENVRMSKESEAVISRFCSIEPIFINSKLLSAQSRPRLYWTNIGTNKNNLFGIEQPGIKQPKDKGILLKDILQSEVHEKYFLSEKIIKGFYKKNERNKNFAFNPIINTNIKAGCLTARYYKCSSSDNYIFGKKFILKNPIKSPFMLKEERTEKGKLIRKQSKKDYTPRNKQNKQYTNRQDKKANCLTTLKSNFDYVFLGEKQKLNIRRLTPGECFRLQTIPKKYAQLLLNSGISDTQLYKMAGNGWTVDVISYILSHLK